MMASIHPSDPRNALPSHLRVSSSWVSRAPLALLPFVALPEDIPGKEDTEEFLVPVVARVKRTRQPPKNGKKPWAGLPRIFGPPRAYMNRPPSRKKPPVGYVLVLADGSRAEALGLVEAARAAGKPRTSVADALRLRGRYISKEGIVITRKENAE
jgi:hypothetical protein